jgi:hypothetical protein
VLRLCDAQRGVTGRAPHAFLRALDLRGHRVVATEFSIVDEIHFENGEDQLIRIREAADSDRQEVNRCKCPGLDAVEARNPRRMATGQALNRASRAYALGRDYGLA